MPKQHRTDDALDGHDHDLPVDLAKLSLRTADEVKEIQAATLRTILVPADCHFVTLPLHLRIALGTKVGNKISESRMFTCGLLSSGLKRHCKIMRMMPTLVARQVSSTRSCTLACILDIVMAALTKVGGQEKYGTAPKSS